MSMLLKKWVHEYIHVNIDFSLHSNATRNVLALETLFVCHKLVLNTHYTKFCGFSVHVEMINFVVCA